MRPDWTQWLTGVGCTWKSFVHKVWILWRKLTSAVFSSPWALPLRKLMMCTSWGWLVVPRLAHPERTVKLFNIAWTGWPTPTGSSSQGLRDNGPANNTKMSLTSKISTHYAQLCSMHSSFFAICTKNTISHSLRLIMGMCKGLCGKLSEVTSNPRHQFRVSGKHLIWQPR